MNIAKNNDKNNNVVCLDKNFSNFLPDDEDFSLILKLILLLVILLFIKESIDFIQKLLYLFHHLLPPLLQIHHLVLLLFRS